MSPKISAYITRLNRVLMLSVRTGDLTIGYIMSPIQIAVYLTARGFYISASTPDSTHPMVESFFVDEVFIDGKPFTDVYILVTPEESA